MKSKLKTLTIILLILSFGCTKNCIVGFHKKTFLVIRPMSKEVRVKVFSLEDIVHPLVLKSYPLAKRFEIILSIKEEQDLGGKLIDFLYQSYQIG